jgi:FAD/FMN-containing dehydrogenase
VNFGFWDVKRTREKHPAGHFNRLIEAKVAELGGIKSLYSDSFFGREEFDARYGGEAYAELKRRYDPQGVFPQLYAKCVLRQ